MPAMSRLRVRAGLLLALTALSTAACNAPLPLEPTGTPTWTPTPTLVPTPTVTPTPVPEARLDDADTALLDGDWDAALAEYRAVSAEASDPALRGSADYGVGVTLLRARRYAEADQALSAYIAAFAEGEWLAQAYLLRALAKEAAAQWAQAADDYAQYLSRRPGHIDAFVHERAGDALRQAARPLDAIPQYQQAIDAPRLGDAINLHLKIGRAYMEAADFRSALDAFDGVYQSAGDAATKATANFLAGQALESLGDVQGAYQRYLDSVTNYPGAYDAYSGLVRLVDAGVPVDNFQRGLVDYNTGAYAPAIDAFTRVIASSPTADAYYYRGLAEVATGDGADAAADLRTLVLTYPADPNRADAWMTLARVEWALLGQPAQAVQTYLNLVAVMPSAPQAPQALFDAARTAERANDLTQAAQIWLRVPVEFPGSPLAPQAAFLSGVTSYRLSDQTAALAAFQKAEELAADTGQRAAALLWTGKVQQAQGDAAGAREAWQSAAEADPTGYYSLRAEDLLGGRKPFQPLGVFDFSADTDAERQQAEIWLRNTFAIKGPEPLTALDPGLAGDQRMIRGEEFMQLGLFDEAEAEFDALRKAIANDGEANYRLMHKLLALHLYQPAIYTARQILTLAGMDDAATANAPAYFNHIRFGPYFGELILPQAMQDGFDGLFLLSVVRQESLFEGFATSYAAARGLMQIIPDTGAMIAQQLGWPPDYTDQDLYRPLVSVRFGAYYLAEQRDRFGGDLYAALAAYNAGPGSAEVWKESAPDDPDLFLEVIRIDQPQQYIKTIYEVFARYRGLYNRP